MTFLHTIFLAALAAAAIPILIHLLSRQRLPLIKFSSLEFLRRLQKRKSRRIKLRQLILLALRALAIAALALVFARPALKSGKAAGAAASVEMLILLDDGITSATETNDGQLLTLCAAKCTELTKLAERNDRITLIRMTTPEKRLTAQARTRDVIVDRLNDAEPRLTAPLPVVSFTAVDSIFTTSELFNRELYMVSGFYGSAWDSAALEPTAKGERIFLLPVGPEELDNIVVSTVQLKSSILQRGEPVELEADFSNQSSRPLKDVLVSVYLEGERVAQASLDLPANSAVSRSFSVTPAQSGFIAGMVKCEDVDPLTCDSRRYFMLNIPDSLNALCIAPDRADSLILAAALSGSQAGFVRLKWGNPVGWETTSLAGFDVLILTGVKSVSSGASERVAEFVERGGGLIIFQGMESDLAGLSRGLWNRLGFAGARGTIVEGSFGWGKYDLQHPLFSGIFEDKGSPRSPSFRFAVDLAVGKGDQVIIPLANGRPFLIERQVGRGRALMYAAPLSPGVGDFAFTGIIAPLIFRSVGYAAAGGSGNGLEWITGRDARVLLSLPRAETGRLTTPIGDVIDLPPRLLAGGVEYTVLSVEESGIYDLKVAGKTVARYAANVPTDQSRLKRADLNALGKRLGGATVFDAKDENLAETVHAARFGRELWQPIAAIFLLLLVSETLLGRAWKREVSE